VTGVADGLRAARRLSAAAPTNGGEITACASTCGVPSIFSSGW
jgi:hypothetical protein